MINKKDLELKILLKECKIQQLEYRINRVLEFIQDNYTNNDGSIWNRAMARIYIILNNLEGEDEE